MTSILNDMEETDPGEGELEQPRIPGATGSWKGKVAPWVWTSGCQDRDRLYMSIAKASLQASVTTHEGPTVPPRGDLPGFSVRQTRSGQDSCSSVTSRVHSQWLLI